MRRAAFGWGLKTTRLDRSGLYRGLPTYFVVKIGPTPASFIAYFWSFQTTTLLQVLR